MEETLYTGYVYLIYNDVNDRVYIGETLQKITTRFKQHLQMAFNNKRKYDGPLFRAMRKYGKEHFFIKQLECITGTDRNKVKKEIQRLEVIYIKKYNSFHSGYNCNSGGGEGARIPSEEIKQKERIAKLQMSNLKEFMSYVRSYQDLRISINMYEYNSGKLIETFQSIKDASMKYNLDSSSITKICKGKTNYLRIDNRKVTFRYFNESYNPKYTVECFTDSLGVIEKFIEAKDGAVQYKVDPSAVVRCCKGKSESAGKYNNEKLKWRYVN